MSNPKSGSRSEMEAIHAAMVEALKKRVEKAKTGDEPLTASEITAIARFLNDSDVKASEEDRAAVGAVGEAFPFPPSELPSKDYNRV